MGYIRIRPSSKFDVAPITYQRKYHLKRWYMKAIHYIPVGYKNRVWVSIPELKLDHTIDRINQLRT